MEIKVIKTAEDFKEAMKGTSVIKFFANWCGPCKQLTKVIEHMEPVGDIQYYEADVENDALEEVVGEYKIMSLPTQLFVKHGEVVSKTVGLIPEAKIKEEMGKLA